MIVTARSIHELAARSLIAAAADHGPSELVQDEVERAVAVYRALVRASVAAMFDAHRADWGSALDVMLAHADLGDLARSLVSLRLRAAVLGADDSRIEAETDEVLEPDPFPRSLETLRCLAGAPKYRKGVGTHTDPVKPWPEVVDEFRSRGAVTRDAWDEMTRKEREEAFTVAYQSSHELVRKIQDVVAQGLKDGESTAAIRFRVQVAGDGIAADHAETVYRNAVQSAYARGRYTHMAQPHVVAARPWWQTRAVDDRRTRATHAAVDGWVMRADDPGWQATAAPYGHRCRCRLVARSDRWVQKNGPTIHTGPLPKLPDPGWTNKPPPIVSLRVANAAPPPSEKEPPAEPDRPSKGPSLLRPADRHLDRATRRALEKLDSIDKTRTRRIRPADLGLRRPTEAEREAMRSPFRDRGVDPAAWAELEQPRLETVELTKILIDRPTLAGKGVADIVRQAGRGERAVAVKVGDRYHVIAHHEHAAAYVVDDTIGGAGKVPLKVFDAPPPLARRYPTQAEARDALATALGGSSPEAVRDESQRLLATHGLSSRDNWRGLPNGRRLVAASERFLERQFGAVALHAKSGAIVQSAPTLRRARAALEKAARGLRLTANEAKGLRALLHEEVHGCGADHYQATKQAAGIMLEEAVTDIAARRVVDRTLGGSLKGTARDAIDLPPEPIWSWRGPLQRHPYDVPISRILAVARKHGIADRDVQEAALAIKSRGADTTMLDARAYIDRWADELVAQSGVKVPVQTLAKQLFSVLKGGLRPMKKPVGLARGQRLEFAELDGTKPKQLVEYFDQELPELGLEEAQILAHSLAMMAGGDRATWELLLEHIHAAFADEPAPPAAG